jgi:porin
LFEPPFNDSGGQLTNLYWKQYMFEGKWAAVAGFLDVTDFVDVYLLASPWTGFNNFVFSTGSAAMDLPNNATLGLGAGGMISKNGLYPGGLFRCQLRSDLSLRGLRKCVDESDFFKWVEVGLTPGQDKIYFDNLHVTFWHIDERVNGTPDGWGSTPPGRNGSATNGCPSSGAAMPRTAAVSWKNRYR